MRASRSSSQPSASETAPSSTQPPQLVEYRQKLAEKKRLNKLRGQELAETMRQRRASSSYTANQVSKKRQTKSQKACLIFPVNKFIKELKKACPGFLVRENAGVMTAGVIEYLIAEVLELSGLNAISAKKKRIVPVHIGQAVRDDEEVMELLKGVTISRGGVMQFIHPSLTKKVEIRRSRPDEGEIDVMELEENMTAKSSPRNVEE